VLDALVNRNVTATTGRPLVRLLGGGCGCGASDKQTTRIMKDLSEKASGQRASTLVGGGGGGGQR